MSKKYEDALKILFEKADIGQLTIRLPSSEELTFSGDIDGPICDIIIHDWQIMGMLTKRGDIGLGEAYHLGFWDSSDVPDFLTYCSLNLSSIKNKGQASFFNKIFFYLHNQLVRANTLYGSKKNILEHYDIGNDFYQSWLDPTMTYSSAIKTSDKDSLMDAQLQKYQRIINKINVQNKDILEIGCGWGGFAEEAVVTGARVTGLTISNEQYDFAKKRLNGNAEILMKDYRKIKGTFDRIVSIEMFEAVGEKFWKTYFDQVKRLLKKNGQAMIQTITIDNKIFPEYRKKSDYIRHHVFPGGMLPSKEVFCSKARASKLEVGEIFEFGKDYAWTLQKWRENFSGQKNKLLENGCSKSFLRSWEFYLSICIAGFNSNRTNVMQVEILN